MCVCAHSNCFPFSILVTLGNDDGSGFTHLQSSMPVTFCNTHKHCVPTWPCMVRASRTLKNPVIVPAALKNRVLMISCFLPLSLFIPVLWFSSLFLTLVFLSVPLTHFQSPDFTEIMLLIVFISPSSDCLSPVCPSFTYWTADRQIYSLGSTQYLKCLNTTGCCEGGKAPGEWIHDTSLLLRKSPIAKTHCATIET